MASKVHFSGLMQKLSDQFQEEFDHLEEAARETEEGLENNTDSLSTRIDKVLADIEKDINEIFASARDTNKQTLKDKFEATRSQVEELSHDTGKQVKDEVSELTGKLSQNSLQANHALRKKCEELKERAQADMNSFVGRMTENVTESEATRQQLADAKARVIAEIKAELVTIRDGFEANLKSMMQSAMDDLNSVQDEVVSDMKQAYDRSLLKIGNDSQGARNEIEEATKKLLAMISKNRTQALEEIARAAGE
jgi:hypothetical protein